MDTENTTSVLTSELQVDTRKRLGERIRQLWVLSGEPQDEFVKTLGVSTVTLSNYMSGKRKPDSEFLFAIKKKLNICLDWLIDGSPPMYPGDLVSSTQDGRAQQPSVCDVDIVMVPRVAARLAAGTGSLETEGEIKGHYAFRSDWIRRKGCVGSMVLMDVTGDSMQPEIKHGDMVLVDQSKKNILGYGYFAVGIDDAVYVKQLRSKPGKLILHSLNPDYDDIEVDMDAEQPSDVRIIGRVLWVGRELA